MKAYWRSVERAAILAALGLAPGGCVPPQETRPVAAVTAAEVESQETHGRPSLTLVDRKGDPQKGLAMAVYLDGRPRIAASLAWLVEARLSQAALRARVEASPFGLVVSLLAASPEAVQIGLKALHHTLFAPPTAKDVARVRAHWRASPPPQAHSAHEAAAAWCAGELLLAPGLALPPPDLFALTTWMNRISVSDISFALVGTDPYLQAARIALEALPDWPRHPTEQPRAALVGEQRKGIEITEDADGLLSVAVAGLAAPIATALAEHLGSKDALLSVRMRSGFPAWKTTRVTATLQRSGACLRADFRATGAAPSVSALRRSVAVAIDEIEHATSVATPTHWVLDKQVLAISEPDRAAAVAAWQALTAESNAAGPVRLAHYSGRISDPENSPQFSSPVELNIEQRSAQSALQLESGQGEYWMLLASPCGTLGENADNAGLLALTLHALARQHSSFRGVELEPWLTPDAAGLLAHSGPMHRKETPLAQAERIAESLAQALLSPGPNGLSIGESRATLKHALGGAELPGYWLALRQGSANHPSWFEPRGSWQALTEISVDSVRRERMRWVASNLRLAVLGNYDAPQIQAGQARLLRLLQGVNRAEAECPQPARIRPRSGRYRLAATGSQGASATLLITWPNDSEESKLVAQWTADLMNKPGGWLEQALRVPELVSSARSRVMGGRGTRALVIEVVAETGRLKTAVAQVRGLLERLRAGAVTEPDVRWAHDRFVRRKARSQLDPRVRIVQLWRSPTDSPLPTREQLLSAHQRVFGAGREVVVLSTPRG